MSDDEECPICHTKRYFKQNMVFLVNPDCYHQMCSACVERIFSNGPALCPIPGCKKTLRRNKFRPPTFSDLALEREIDIRKRVQNVFTRRETDFETLRAYNDYLNDVEDITYNLIHNIDIEDTTKKLQAYEDANREALEESRKPGNDGRGTKRYDDPRKGKAEVAADASKKALYNPFGPMLIEKDFVIVPARTDLWEEYLTPLCTENKYKAGGYSIYSFYEHAITDAYAGLGVFIGEEMARKGKKAEADIDVS